MADMKPFADDDSAVSVGGLTIENGTDCISVSGSLDLARDKQGLGQARALRDLCGTIVTALEAEKDLPAKAAKPKPAAMTRKPNPFF